MQLSTYIYYIFSAAVTFLSKPAFHLLISSNFPNSIYTTSCHFQIVQRMTYWTSTQNKLVGITSEPSYRPSHYCGEIIISSASVIIVAQQYWWKLEKSPQINRWPTRMSILRAPYSDWTDFSQGKWNTTIFRSRFFFLRDIGKTLRVFLVEYNNCLKQISQICCRSSERLT